MGGQQELAPIQIFMVLQRQAADFIKNAKCQKNKAIILYVNRHTSMYLIMIYIKKLSLI